MSLDSMKEIFDRMEAEHKPFWEIVLETDMDERQVTRQQSMAKMLTTWQYMVDAADTYTGRRRSVSGLVGGDGLKMRQRQRGHRRGPVHGGVQRLHAPHCGGPYGGRLRRASGGAAAHVQV